MVPQPVAQTAQPMCLGEQSPRAATSAAAWQLHVLRRDGGAVGRGRGGVGKGSGFGALKNLKCPVTLKVFAKLPFISFVKPQRPEIVSSKLSHLFPSCL